MHVIGCKKCMFAFHFSIYFYQIYCVKEVETEALMRYLGVLHSPMRFRPKVFTHDGRSHISWPQLPEEYTHVVIEYWEHGNPWVRKYICAASNR